MTTAFHSHRGQTSCLFSPIVTLGFEVHPLATEDLAVYSINQPSHTVFYLVSRLVWQILVVSETGSISCDLKPPCPCLIGDAEGG